MPEKYRYRPEQVTRQTLLLEAEQQYGVRDGFYDGPDSQNLPVELLPVTERTHIVTEQGLVTVPTRDVPIKYQQIFGEDPRRPLAVFYNNVGDLITNAPDEYKADITLRYGTRIGATPNGAAREVGIATTEVTNELEDHILSYVDHLYGEEKANHVIVTLEEIKQVAEAARKAGDTSPLVVPYINLPETKRLIESLGAQTWGFNAEAVHLFKNKKTYRELVDKIGDDKYKVPDYTVAPIINLETAAEEFLNKEVIGLYREHNLLDDYPAGVILQTPESDGGKGTVMIVEDQQKRNDGDPKYITFRSEETEETGPIYYTNWNEAFKEAKTQLLRTTSVEDDVIISRLIQTEKGVNNSPGESILIMDGYLIPLGWNGQIQNNAKACIGTQQYEADTIQLEVFQMEHEIETTDDAVNFLYLASQELGIDLRNERGFLGFDMLIPGNLERTLMKERNQTNVVYYIEINPRFTDHTNAELETIRLNGKIATMQTVQDVQTTQVLSYNHWKLGEDDQNIDPKTLRTIVSLTDTQTQEDTQEDGYRTRIELQMPENHGIIFTGDTEIAEEKLRHNLSAKKANT